MVRESKILVITEIEDFRTTPRHSACSACESTEFEYPLAAVGVDDADFNLGYEPGSTTTRKLFAVRVHTDTSLGVESDWNDIEANATGSTHA